MKKLALSLMLLASAGMAKAQCNLVTNGDFSAGGSGFSSDYTVSCGSPISLYPEGTYCVSLQANDHHNGFAPCNNGGNIMVVNGTTSQLSPGVYKSIWNQTVAVTPNTSYTFSVDAASVVAFSAGILRLSVNGSSSGTTTLNLTNCSWQTLTYVWNSGAATTATLNITDENLAPSGNDFALDNITFHTPAELNATSVQDADCSALGTGSITVTATPGYGPYTFTIASVAPTPYTASSGSVAGNTFTFTGLAPFFNYVINVTDGCGDVTTLSSSIAIDKKVAMAHMTGSTRNPCVNICIAAAAVPAHLAHGDYVGTCPGARMIYSNAPDDIQVVPNPNAGVFKINLPILESEASLMITDVQGRLIQHTAIAEDASAVDVNISQLGKGVYFISVSDVEHKYRTKFVVE